MELHFQIEKQELKRIDKNKPVDFSSEYLQCHFDFLSDDWDDFGKFAIFRVKDKNYRVVIVEGLCTVPFDALKGNRFILTVYGVKDDVRITTNYVWIHLKDSAFVDEYDESSYFNPDMTEELLDLVETKVDKSVFNDAIEVINGNFDDLNSDIESINTDISNLNASKTDKIEFNETVSNLEDAIDNLGNVKVDKSVFNNTVSDLQDSIDTKTDISVFNDTVSDLEDSINELDTNKTVTITKQATADTGYFSTYVLNQGGTALSPKINIPKDYLLKSASILQCTVKDEPIEGLNVGDWYFDWVLNTDDGTGEETHLYLNANVLTDVYEADNETIIITDNVISVKPNVFAFKVHTHSKSDITDFTHTHSKSDITNFSHTHTKNEITDFAHTHTESDITDLRNYALESEVYSKSEVDELLHNLNNRIQVNSTKDVIQVGDTTDIYAHTLKNGMPCIQKKIHFFEKISPIISLSSSAQVIETGDDMDIYAKVYDEDGSLAQNMKVHFFKEEEEELINENIETNNLNNDMEEE